MNISWLSDCGKCIVQFFESTTFDFPLVDLKPRNSKDSKNNKVISKTLWKADGQKENSIILSI